MKQLIGLCLLLPMISLAKPGLTSYWVCDATEQTTGQHWQAQGQHQRAAVNKAFEACKQQAQNPASCHVATEWCRYQSANYAAYQRWRCSAFDNAGGSWFGDYHNSRSEAVEGAVQVCKQFSMSPNTCQVILITCNYLGQT